MIDIKTEEFQGPLTVLLNLIQEEKLDITRISLAKIADQYTEHIQNIPQINPVDLSDFLVVAAKLLLIKSKALLPYLYTEEEDEIRDFEEHLKMYQEFLRASEKIKEILEARRFMFTRVFDKRSLIQAKFSPPAGVSKDILADVFLNFLKKIEPEKEKLEEEVIERKISLEEKIMEIQSKLLKSIKISFNKIIHNIKSKNEIVVSFLAVLELAKQRQVSLEQKGLFEELLILKS